MAVRVAFDEVDSTQSVAIDRAKSGAPDGTYVVAGVQTNGTGRTGRSWSSPRGGLYVSWIGTGALTAPGLLPLAVAVEIRRALPDGVRAQTRLKWPNDLLVLRVGHPAQKLAGILTDRVNGPDETIRAVVGVGLNVATPRTDLPEEIRSRTAILAELVDPAPDVREYEDRVVESIARAVARLDTPEGRASVVAECREHLIGLGEPVRIDGRPVGTLRALCEDGAAAVEQDGTTFEIRAGELTLPELA